MGFFADDTRLWKKVVDQKGEEELQIELGKMYSWADGDNMQFNSKTFEGM